MSFYDHITSEECGFQRSEADQCLFYKIGKRGLIVLLLYVNDSAIIGNKEDINETIRLIQLRFTITSEGRLNDFLGCDILRNKDKKCCYLLQPHLINKLQRTFGKLREVKRDYATPGTP